MASTNDCILAATGGPTVTDGLIAYFLANGAIGGAYQDLERQFLIAQGGNPLMSNNGMWYQVLGAAGFTGSLDDRQNQFWCSGGQLTPQPVFDALPVLPSGEIQQNIDSDSTTDVWVEDYQGVLQLIPAGTVPIEGARFDGGKFYAEPGVTWWAIAELAATNHALHSRDLTNGGWWRTNAVVDTTQIVAADGALRTTNILRATAANGMVNRQVTRVAGPSTFQLYLRRRVGVGDVEIRMIGDTQPGWVVVPVTAQWQQFSVSSASMTNPDIRLRCKVSGDEIEVDFIDCTTLKHVSSPIPATTAAVSRNITEFYFPKAAVADWDELSAFALMKWLDDAADWDNSVQVLSNGAMYIASADSHLAQADGPNYVGKNVAFSAGDTDLFVVRTSVGGSLTDTTASINGTVFAAPASTPNGGLGNAAGSPVRVFTTNAQNAALRFRVLELYKGFVTDAERDKIASDIMGGAHCTEFTGSVNDYEDYYTGAWRSTSDVVDGWDWTLPAGVLPAAGSGIFNLNTAIPANFPGNHLKQVDAKWKDLEPTEGNYDFSSIIADLNDSAYDGVMLNIRCVVVAIEDAAGDPQLPWEITAPTWLSDTAPQTQEALKNGYRITNLNISDATVKAALIALIQAIGASVIPAHAGLTMQVVHGVSASRGEEWNGTQAGTAAAETAMEDIIAEWGTAYGANAKKLAWLKEDPRELFDAAVTDAGMGMRGGAIEYWMVTQYTPGEVDETGQLFDADGYLSVDETFAPIAEGRAWMDENENWRDDKFGLKWKQNFRMANFRMLQMRRAVAWTDDDSLLNPDMLNWLSLELGKTSATSPDAWCVVTATWSRKAGVARRLNNFERWLYQRDIDGVTTTPTLNVTHDYNATNNELLPESYWHIDMGRKATRIGFAVDPAFLTGGPHDVAIKVTYFDQSCETWSLVYENSSAQTVMLDVVGTATGKVRTATFVLNDFAAPNTGLTFDFTLESLGGKTPYMFVRVVKV